MRLELICKIVPPLYHPNVFPSGDICLSMLDKKNSYSSSITITEILLEPNNSDPVQA
ncbi:hypothetical protein B484DRAFT_406756 [Ochromonadaceae sp. CCMP2298]|nr:hypothetical protein B484DRAFT_406756 [Ochromonadaceae sp. CCMP2298]